jgi:hypothetical protein
MILIDSNVLVILILGLIDPNLIGKDKRSSIYEKEDFHKLLDVIGSIDKVVVLPNIWTEVDNLLNHISGSYKFQYIEKITSTIRATSEEYLKSSTVNENPNFINLGLTDTLILDFAKRCDFLITDDSRLSDFACANGILVYDMKSIRNERLK